MRDFGTTKPYEKDVLLAHRFGIAFKYADETTKKAMVRELRKTLGFNPKPDSSDMDKTTKQLFGLLEEYLSIKTGDLWKDL